MIVSDRRHTDLSERQKLSRAQEGDGAAFDRLFHEHKDAVYSCLWHLLDGDAEQVEEAVGNVFLSAYRSLGRFRGDSAFSTWLFRIAINEAHACVRRRRRHKMLGFLSFSDPDVELAPGPESGDPAIQLLQAEEERTLSRAVRAVPEPYRTPLILRYVSGLPAPEIASALKRPAGTIRYQLSRALQILRERLGSDWSK
jgi:RNA polymerase sigma-70 factor (ECF subfamily)